MANDKYPTMTTPRGVFVYPHLTTPDTKFVKPDGEYHMKFALKEGVKITKKFVTALERILLGYIEENPEGLTKAKLKKAGQADFYEAECDDEGEETGRILFKFKLKAKVVTKTKSWDQKPRLFDSAAQPITEDLNIWTGTEGKVNVEVFPYYMESTKQFGLSLRCKGVQILKLVEGSGGPDAAAMGFGEEDDGYVATAEGAEEGFGPEGEEGEDESEF